MKLKSTAMWSNIRVSARLGIKYPIFQRASHLTPAREQAEVNPAEIYECVHKHVPSNMEGVFIGGNVFRAIGVIAALEEDLGRPVLTGNQVAFWCALRLAGAGAEVDDYGQAFRKIRSGQPPETR
jgi:maleate cis-trans isomerase